MQRSRLCASGRRGDGRPAARMSRPRQPFKCRCISRTAKRLYSIALFAVAVAVLPFILSAAEGPTDGRESPETAPSSALAKSPAGLPPILPVPGENPLSKAKIELGRRLFFDTLLSTSRDISCATCHEPEHGFAQTRRLPVGHAGQIGRRNAPSLLNRAYGEAFFWDGRAATLEQQALEPIKSPRELATGVPVVLERLGDDPEYRQQFDAAFGDGITAENLARAIASYERTLLAGDSPVDRFQAAKFSALAESERQGLWLFESRGRCWKCHSGPNFSDEGFHNTGVSWGKQPTDLGRFEITGDDRDRGRFKTPTLRGVALTAPYMHDGSVATLRDVVEFYNRGGVKNPSLDPHVESLELSDKQISHLVAFLEALSRKAQD